MSSDLMADNNEGGRNDGNTNGKGSEGVDGTTPPMTNGPTSTNHDPSDSSFPSTYDVPTSSTIDPVNPVYITPGLATGPPSAGLGLTGYSPFSSTGDGSWTPTFDPMGLGGGFGFNHSGVLNPPLQNQFFFPSNDPIGVWGQDSLMVNNSWLMNPVPMDPQTQITNAGPQVGLEVGPSINPVGTLGQSFSGMSLNGSMHSLIPTLGTPAIIPAAVPAAPGQNVPPTQPTPIVQPPVAPPPQPEKPKSWAAIASQPAKPKPPPPQKQSPEADTSKKQQQQQTTAWTSQSGGSGRGTSTAASVVSSGNSQAGRGPRRATVPKNTPAETTQSTGHSEVVSKLKAKNNYNPSELTVNMTNARFFVIKSYAEDDVHRSIKYNVWCSTEHGNRRLDGAFRDQKAKGGNVFLFFSVNGSGHFCGVAQMASEIDFGSDTGLWTQDKWKGRFDLKWLYVKDVPNNQLRHIRLENNENKPVTNSRDTQEVPYDKGRAIMKLMHSYNHTTSIFDDFEHYEKRQEEDGAQPSANSTGSKKQKLLKKYS